MKQLLQSIKNISFGRWSLAMFFIALITGIILVIPYNVSEPYKSISTILIANPYASLARNMHYWSAQLFLLTLFFHFFEHFKKKKPVRLNSKIWLRVSLGIVIIFLLMFTGFLLKGDADAIQAREIFNSILSEIPAFGTLISYLILGKSGSWQLIYINHIATLTIITLYIIFEHSRKIWPETAKFVWSIILLIPLSLLFSAPLHNNVNPTVKGPWYFVGLQDLLHWLSNPQLAIIIIFFVLALVYLAGNSNRKLYFPARRLLLYISIGYLFLSIDGLFFRGKNWKQTLPWQKNYSYEVFGGYNFEPVIFTSAKNTYSKNIPLINGRPESCIICHKNVSGFTPSHNPDALGCFSCHGGNPFSIDKNTSHKGMILIPGNLLNADKTCGNTDCHPDITKRINSALMTTLSGMINVDRYVFNEQKTPDGNTTLKDIHHSAADEHLKNLCVRCHLGNEKTEPGPVSEESRGGGCLACHINYDNNSLEAHNKHESDKTDTSYLKFHPSVSLNVSNNHCFGCHSRSGRISTNFEGWHETTLYPAEIKNKQGFRIIDKNRVFRYVKDDIHHAYGMECIDCHTSYELMGDGVFYQHQEQQQDVACSDCHTKNPKTINGKDIDNESAIIASLRFGNFDNKEFIKTEKHKKPLINVFENNDSVFLIGKNSKKIFYVKPPSSMCERDNVHGHLSCSSCHSSWAPTCIGCHNSYDYNEPGYNMITNKEKLGSWVEYIGTYEASPPTLGIKKHENSEEVIPVIPGMILTIDKKSFNKNIHDSLLFKRLFAPAAPHTTSQKGRSCKSCHNNPLALGYGKGKLIYSINNGKGNWTFIPEYENNIYDSLPEDAWIPFLGIRTENVSTRSDVFPLPIEKQKRILTVGACLTCHDENSEIIKNTLTNYTKTKNMKSKKCILPFW